MISHGRRVPYRGKTSNNRSCAAITSNHSELMILLTNGKSLFQVVGNYSDTKTTTEDTSR